jgi:hypothetical protein
MNVHGLPMRLLVYLNFEDFFQRLFQHLFLLTWMNLEKECEGKYAGAGLEYVPV